VHRSDVIAGFSLFVLGLFTIFVLVPDQISGKSDYGIAPDVYPLTLLWLFTLLCGVLGTHRLLKWAHMKYEPILTRADWLFIVGSIIYLIIAYIAINSIGFRWGGSLLLLILLWIMGVLTQKYVKSILVAGITPLVLYYLFWNIFRIPLP